VTILFVFLLPPCVPLAFFCALKAFPRLFSYFPPSIFSTVLLSAFPQGVGQLQPLMFSIACRSNYSLSIPSPPLSQLFFFWWWPPFEVYFPFLSSSFYFLSILRKRPLILPNWHLSPPFHFSLAWRSDLQGYIVFPPLLSPSDSPPPRFSFP